MLLLGRPPGQQDGGNQREHDLAPLIPGGDLEPRRAAIGPGRRGAHLQHLPLDAEQVAGGNRPRPAQIVRAEADQAVERPRLTVDEHPHRQRHRVPARRDQPTEDASPGRVLVEMEWLRVEGGGKRLDLPGVDRDRAAGVSLADRKVLEIAGARGWTRYDVGLR